jgi:hypothetical protein
MSYTVGRIECAKEVNNKVMEEVLHEMRIVETEDGYRLEIKGDKERMKKFFEEHRRGVPCPPPFMLPFMFWRGMRHGWSRRHGRHGSPWGWDYEEEDEPDAGE